MACAASRRGRCKRALFIVYRLIISVHHLTNLVHVQLPLRVFYAHWQHVLNS